MAKYQGWKKRYSYLNDYKKGMDGKYVYYGRHYIVDGGSPACKRIKLILGITDILLVVLFVISGLLDAGRIWNTWYVVIPFAVQVVMIFLLAWKSLSLIMEKYPVKEYIYKRSVPWFKPCTIILAVTCLVSICMTGLCMILETEWIKSAGCIIYMVINLVMAAVCFASVKMTGSYAWEPDPSENVD